MPLLIAVFYILLNDCLTLGKLDPIDVYNTHMCLYITIWGHIGVKLIRDTVQTL